MGERGEQALVAEAQVELVQWQLYSADERATLLLLLVLLLLPHFEYHVVALHVVDESATQHERHAQRPAEGRSRCRRRVLT